MQKIKIAKNGINYLSKVLLEKPNTITRSLFWRIHRNSGQEDVSLKIGRYNKKEFCEEELETKNPKSELTLTNSELESLVSFLKENYEPFKDGVNKYISFDLSSEKNLISIFQSQEKEKLFKCILDNDLIEEDLLQSVEIKKKKLDIDIFEKRLANPNLLEDKGHDNWQDWFSKNKWFFGSDYVKILKRRTIDENSKTDFLASSYGNFLDIVEIKRPSLDDGKLFKEGIIEKEGAEWKYYHPTMDLTKAISQCYRYINEIEKKVGDPDSGKKFEECEIVKPRCTLIFGRSNNFTKDEYKALRILNSHYNNFSIVTYDQLLERAKKMVEIIQNKKQND